MEIENSQPQLDWKTIFTPLTPLTLNAAQNQHTVLRTPFSLLPNSSPSCLLTLIQDRLLLEDSLSSNNSPCAEVQLCFDLKFEVLQET